jgi:hypothetical protein
MLKTQKNLLVKPLFRNPERRTLPSVVIRNQIFSSVTVTV